MSREPIWLLWYPGGIPLRIAHNARGAFVPASAREFQAVSEKIRGANCQIDAGGQQYVPMKAVLTLGRRKRHHDALMAFIRAAFENWPLDHPFKPDSEEHLRAWLLVEAKHRTVDVMFLRTAGEADAVKAYADFERRRARWSFPKFTERREGGELVGFDVEISTALSINWETLGEDEFRKVSEPVFEIIAAAWMPFDEWKKLKEKNR